jgi:hypothetical protein
MSAGGENSCTSPIISVVATDKPETSARSHILPSFSQGPKSELTKYMYIEMKDLNRLGTII